MSSKTDLNITVSDRQKQYGVAEAARLEKRNNAEALRSEKRKQEDAAIDSGAGKWRYHPPGNRNDEGLNRP
jgi:hypothetical protein